MSNEQSLQGLSVTSLSSELRVSKPTFSPLETRRTYLNFKEYCMKIRNRRSRQFKQALTDIRPGASILCMLLIFVSIISLGGCDDDEHTLRYRITVSVSVGEQIISGSEVEQTTMTEISLKLGYPISYHFRGQAIKVDLGDRGMLFILLVADEKRKNGPLEMRAAPISYFPSYFRDVSSEPRELVERIAKWKRDKPCAQIPVDTLPMLVRFRDIGDYRSVEYVNLHDLSESFGPGVSILDARICYTNDTSKMDLSDTLKWLADGKVDLLKPQASEGPPRSLPQIDRLTILDFKETK